MNDRELLEYAAKAACIKYFSFIDDPIFGFGINIGGVDTPLWNPLTDDGDALRLANRLKLDINFWEESVCVGIRGKRFDEIELDGSSTYARENATRRAIVRAAAEIGKVKS